MIFRYACIGAALLAASGLPAATQEKAETYPVGDIQLVPYAFCPGGMLPANGQLLLVSEHPALFSVYGTLYGGDGQTSFGLPDMRAPTELSPETEAYLTGTLANDPSLNSGTVRFDTTGRELAVDQGQQDIALTYCVVLSADARPQN